MSNFGFKLTSFWNNVSIGMKAIRNIPKNNIVKSVTTIKIEKPQTETKKMNKERVNSSGYQKTMGHRRI